MSNNNCIPTMPHVDVDLTASETALLKLPDDLSEDLRTAIEQLVNNKYLLDRFAEDGGGRIVNKLHGGGYGAHDGHSFFMLVFPFVSFCERADTSFSALVPTKQTFGASWRWRPDGVEEAEIMPLLSWLTDAKRAEEKDREHASYIWVQPLGLVLSCEGKNRVDFIRKAGAEFIPSRVSAWDYPSPERLAIYIVNVFGRTEWWAALDSRFVQRLDYPALVAPVLDAYGVHKENHWPAEFPSVISVASAFGDRTSSVERDPNTVDLEKLQNWTARQTEVLDCAVVQIPSLKLRWKYWAMWLAPLMACSIGFVLPEAWPLARALGATGFGVGLGMLLTFSLPGFRATRAFIEQIRFSD